MELKKKQDMKKKNEKDKESCMCGCLGKESNNKKTIETFNSLKIKVS